MFWYILAIIVLTFLHYFFYMKAFETRNKLKEFLFMFLTIVITLIICGIIITTFIDLK